MIDEMIQYLAERNPHLVSYRSTAQVASKYHGGDYFIRFVRNWKDSSNQDVNKVGINVKKGWGNPRGIYAYAIDDFNQGNASTFATDYHKAYIIKHKPLNGWIEDIGDLPRNTFVKYSNKLKDFYTNDPKCKDIREYYGDYVQFIKSVEDKSDNTTDGGILFYAVVLMGEKNWEKQSDVFQTYVWRNVLGVTFINDKGHGIIHPNESRQALFLDPRAYEVVDSVDNTKDFLASKFRHGKKNNNVDVMKQAISAGYEPSNDDIIYIINSENTDLIRAIGAWLELETWFRAVNVAINTKNPEIVKLVASLGAKPNENSLDQAIYTNNLEMVKYVVSLGAKPNENSLTRAIETNDLEMVKYVVSLGAKPNENSLTKAINIDNLEIVKYVVSAGAKPKDGSLNYAIQTNNLEMVKYVASLGAKPTEYSLSHAIKTNNLEIVKLVDSLGAKPTEYSLNSAIETKNLEMVKYVVSLGAKPNDTSLNYAIDMNNLDIIKVVVSLGGKPSASSLYNAIDRNNLEIVKLIAPMFNVGKNEYNKARLGKNKGIIDYIGGLAGIDSIEHDFDPDNRPPLRRPSSRAIKDSLYIQASKYL